MAVGRRASLVVLAVLVVALSTNAQDRCTSRRLNPSMYGDRTAQRNIRQCATAVIRRLLSNSNATTDPSTIWFRIEGTFLRMAFHDAGPWDCATGRGGANGSLRFKQELDAGANVGLEEPMNMLLDEWDNMKKAGCPVTFADLLQIAGAEGCFLRGLPRFTVPIGRSDATTPDTTLGNIPGPGSSFQTLNDTFSKNGYTLRDLVALSGAHTIGQSRQVPTTGPMDGTPDRFDNVYFDDLERNGNRRRVRPGNSFNSDSALLDDPASEELVVIYRSSLRRFFLDFSRAYIKMGKMGVNGGPSVAVV